MAKTIVNTLTGINPDITLTGKVERITETVDAYARPDVGTKDKTQGGLTMAISVPNASVTIPLPAFPVVRIGATGSISCTATVTDVNICFDPSKAPEEVWSFPTAATITGRLQTTIGLIVTAGDPSYIMVSGIAAVQTGANISGQLVETSPGHAKFSGTWGTDDTAIVVTAEVKTAITGTTYTLVRYTNEICTLIDGDTHPLDIPLI